MISSDNASDVKGQAKVAWEGEDSVLKISAFSSSRSLLSTLI